MQISYKVEVHGYMTSEIWLMIPVIVVDSCTKTGWECQKKKPNKKNPQ